MEDVESDSRFAHVLKDPRFRRPHIKQRKIKIDSRFKSLLNDKQFSIKVSVDKRGRPIINTPTKENFERLYDYESENDEDSNREDEQIQDEVNENATPKDYSRFTEEEENESEAEGDSSQEEDENHTASEDDEDNFPKVTEDGPDYARGGGMLESSSDDDKDEDIVEEGEEGILDHHWNEPDHDAPEAHDISHRLALCHMDWDRIKARDLYVLFNSFVPQGGALQSVTIYLSQTGKEKIAEEEKLGPREFREGDSVKAGQENEMGELNRAKLRQYQLNRLKYYFAVIVCDSKETANKIYEECDSMEYEKSACRIDLRFIPDDMIFDETVKESCTGVSDLTNFEPSTFTSTAFCQAKVQVTWDETNIDRLKKTMKKFTEEDLDNDHFEELVASSDEEDIDAVGQNDSKSKKKDKTKVKKKMKNYRKLLGLDDSKTSKKKKGNNSLPLIGEEEDDEEEMEFSTNCSTSKPNKVGQSSTPSASEEEGDHEKEMRFTWDSSIGQDKLKKKGKDKLNPWEEYQEKKKENKKLKRQERKKEKLKQQGIEDTADLGFNDPFFKDVPEDGKTKQKRKARRKKKDLKDEEEDEASKKEKASLRLLMEDDTDHLSHFSLTKLMKEESQRKQKKRKKQKDSMPDDADAFEIKLDQSRFGGLYTDPELHIDPTAPEFRKTKGMLTLIEDVSKRRRTAYDAH